MPRSAKIPLILREAAGYISAYRIRTQRSLSHVFSLMCYKGPYIPNINVWHNTARSILTSGGVVSNKIEKIQERALRIIYRNYDSLYPELLRNAGAYTMLDKRLRSMLLHVFKSLKGMNAKCLNDMYSAKHLNYSMRRCVKLVQPQRKTTTAGLKTVSYLGAKL